MRRARKNRACWGQRFSRCPKPGRPRRLRERQPTPRFCWFVSLCFVLVCFFLQMYVGCSLLPNFRRTFFVLFCCVGSVAVAPSPHTTNVRKKPTRANFRRTFFVQNGFFLYPNFRRSFFVPCPNLEPFYTTRRTTKKPPQFKTF